MTAASESASGHRWAVADLWTWAVLKWVVAICIAIVAVFPIWWMVNVVFAEPGAPVSINPRLYPTSFSAGWDKIMMILTETQYLRAYYISVTYALLTILGVLLFGSMAAFEFALFDFPGKGLLFGVVMLSLMVPTAVTIIPTYLLVADLGWLNTMQGLVVPGLASAFGLFMLVQFMRSIPAEMIEAARLDGASHFQIYWHVALPLSKNALVTLAILTFMKTWGNFTWPLIVAPSPETYTVGQVVGLFNAPFSHQTVDVVMTANLLAAVPPLIFFLIFQRKIVEGIAMQGSKG
ncbi:MAG: carbohydrate ABC transporter permease [Cereibacter changlensis]|jgi:multiple sugar transport system permease protein|uniref:Carbohydrate ABC transporter permease n=2 Tax=Cereibacter changlensis TaxID=402884 RepID=A0A2T4JS18_9RHOB|nr:carbohydrate ABC transporter permease [Cereibacter changlensis]PTE20698.1 carbohydrate ABC transporter permease [Cereibacter changlensis JA139]PZX49013.1 multiple sugar transport system permease protein [Cereibacter changlensis]TKA94953.1 carbohydrate ABC transporter permease [Cereibacter changlensis]